ncbi:YitT family protein [Pasteuria penetrans]|uniref:YitT family protein n=1 Tax=Pasteuria penetrans TaxID=86005 RepID=UPI000F92958E|nr:YitT family protein [Pasteuria penetrans]
MFFPHVRNLILITIGTSLISLGLTLFLLPVGLAEGGMTGLGLLLYYQTHWPLSYILLILNTLPIIIFYRILGKKNLFYSLFGTLSLWIALQIMTNIKIPNLDITNDPLLAALYAGFTIGTGCGIIFRTGGGTGGLDTIAQVLYKYRGISIGHTLFCWDSLLLISSMYIITPRRTMYTLIETLIVARVINFIIEGSFRTCRTVTIISSHAPELKRKLNEKIGRGITVWKGEGAYTGEHKEILYIVVANRELHKLKNRVRDLDPKAFMIIHNARDVLGEGFSFHKNHHAQIKKSQGFGKSP